MKLAFNCLNSGLGNNGGTKTVVACAQALEKLGHEVDILAYVDNFTWIPHKPTKRFIPSGLDAVIAVACTDVEHTLRMDVPRKAWYIRGHENWTYSDKQLRELYNAGLFNIVNSKGMQQLLATYPASSVVVYQGIDFDLWKDLKLRPKEKIRIGCLHQEKKTKRWGDFVKLSRILGTEDYEYVSFGLKRCNANFLKEYHQNANVETLNNLYSSCHIWFAPTELEGLHNVPMEAALCGCLVVCSDHPMNGMGFDYAFNDNTAMVYQTRNIEHAAELIREPNWDVIDRMYNCLGYSIGSREENMKKLVEYLAKI